MNNEIKLRQRTRGELLDILLEKDLEIVNLKQELDKYKNIVDELDNKLCSTWQLYYDHSRLTPFKCEDMLGLIEQIRNDIKELKGE